MEKKRYILLRTEDKRIVLGVNEEDYHLIDWLNIHDCLNGYAERIDAIVDYDAWKTMTTKDEIERITNEN